MPNIETAVKWAEAIAADNSHGYSQVHRNGPDYDCSSFVGTALSNAGFAVSQYSTTRNLEAQLVKAGFKKCSSPWKRGDIHLAAGHHVTMSTDATHIVHASQSETGGINGKTGDQTGKEICVRSYYDLPYSNLVHYRYGGASKADSDLNYDISVLTVEGAAKFNKAIAGVYHINDPAGYHLRTGASQSKKSIMVLSQNTSVRNYGYYTGNWYLVALVKNGKQYTGYVYKDGLTRG
jgi:hypothetical protein|nr:MAG TPA: peptidoglycan hydrolase [Caudoviricetes sp.]